jgi:DNA-binding HxlR family transcriptional regulator
MRFSELMRAIPDRFSGYRSGCPITPNLSRLKDSGLVTHDGIDERHGVYKLTPLGESKAEMLIHIINIVESWPKASQET